MSTPCATSVRSDGGNAPRIHPDVVVLILVGLAYFTFAYFGLRFASVNSSATPIWPATGLAIAAMLLWGHRIAPAIFIAAFLINQLTAGSTFTSLAIASGNTAEAVIAGYLVGHWAKGDQIFDTPTGTIKFALISLAATAVSATIGLSSLTLAGYVDVSVLISAWLTWWLGDLAGALVVTPVVVLWAKSDPGSLKAPRIRRSGLLYLAAAAVGAIAFGPLLQQTTLHDALVFIVILPLLWASLREGPRDTATITLIISAFVVWCAVMQCGPFAKPSLNDSFILSLAFIIITAVFSLALSTDVALRNGIEDQERQHELGRVLERQRNQKLQREAMVISDALSLATIRSEALQATLNALASAVYLTDRHGRIVYMNGVAERQVGTGNAIRVKNNHLAHIDHRAQLTLAKAIDEAIGDDLAINGRTVALPGGDNSGLIATIFPLGRSESQNSCGISRMAAIFVQELVAMPFCGGEAFAELYGLTRSELRVLLALAPGLSVREAADTLGIGETTAKTHLQHIYSKTQTSKRAQLMQLFMLSRPPVR